MKRYWLRAFCCFLVLFCGTAIGFGTAPALAADRPKVDCESLARADFSEIEDAPTQIIDAQPIDASDGDPAYCRVRGYISPQVGFEMRLPQSNWNGKFFQVGCGGSCGSTRHIRFCPIQRGYACIASDMGNNSGGKGLIWAQNNLQAQLDLNVRGPHVAAVAGKAITKAYYGIAPLKSYFRGCSSGGVQGLSEAQRFPYDFDGIITLSGSPYRSDMIMQYVWGIRALRDEQGRPRLSQSDLRLVNAEAVKSCDLDDGVQDGVIGNPYACRVNLRRLLCKQKKTGSCLTATQIDAVQKVYAGPVTSKGEKKTFPGGPAPGSELGWIDDSGYITGGADFSDLQKWSEEVLRYMGFTPPPGAKWKLSDFDFDRDYKRLGVAETLWGASNPDLSRLKQEGAKIIAAYGFNEVNSNPAGMIKYYDTVARTMGGLKDVQDFFRLFLVPGMDHCGGGVGNTGASEIDYLDYLEKWVEHGQAPDKLIAAHVNDSYLTRHDRSQLKFPLATDVPIDFTRPIYPYPLRAKYKGDGNPADAGSFVPVTR